jgi:hypothetical protein
MATKKISTRVLDALKPGEYVFDNEIRGFGARRLPSKRVQFFYRYRSKVTGQRVRLAIGLWGDGMTADDARDVALGYATDVRKNKLDPREEAKTAEQAAIDKRDRASLTVSAVCEDYFAGPGAKLRTIGDLRAMYVAHIRDEIGRVPLFDLKRSQIAAMLDRAEKRAAATQKKGGSRIATRPAPLPLIGSWRFCGGR